MRRWLSGFWPRSNKKVCTAEGLGEFLTRQAFFLAQKCTDDYCRGKVGVAHFALSTEDAFRQALTTCRWEGFGAMLSAVAAVAECRLIDAGTPPEAAEAAVIGLVDKILTGQPVPAHRPQGWGDIVEILPDRLRWARSEPRPSLAEIAAPAAKRLFDVLPIHANHRELDEEVVGNSVRFQFVGFSDRFRREVDAEGIARQIAGQA